MQYLLTCIFLVAGHVASNFQSDPQCSSVRSIPNYTLKKHVIYTIRGKSIDTCFTQCEHEEKCFSINYSHTMRLCQLNGKSKVTNPCDLIESDDGTVYMDSLKHSQKDACALRPCKNNSTCTLTSSCQGYVCDCAAEFFKGLHCEDCTSLGEPLGMETRYIPDKAITASSYEPDYLPHSGRFGDKGWVALSNDISNPYFQIELEQVKYISKVRLRGVQAIVNTANINAWIKELFFSCSLDGHTWRDYKNSDGSQMITGLVDESQKVTFMFQALIKAKFFRIVPSQWNQRPALRMELYGCEVT